MWAIYLDYYLFFVDVENDTTHQLDTKHSTKHSTLNTQHSTLTDRSFGSRRRRPPAALADALAFFASREPSNKLFNNVY